MLIRRVDSLDSAQVTNIEHVLVSTLEAIRADYAARAWEKTLARDR